jgi:ubiquinone/menaquinone biosynthesis C-methylase UbiE
MSKQGEKTFLTNQGKEGAEHIYNMPFSHEICGQVLMDVGSIIELLPKPPARLLDLGCGTGWTSCIFAKRGYDVVGHDIAPDMIEYANRKKDEERVNVKFVESDYEHISYDNEFDCAVFYSSLHHAEDEEEALKCAYKALKKNGTLVVFEPGKGHSTAQQSVDVMNKYDVTDKDMPPGYVIRLAKKIGFSGHKFYPQLSQLFKISYTQPNRGRFYKFVLQLGITRVLGVLFIMLYYKHRYGLVVLVK